MTGHVRVKLARIVRQRRIRPISRVHLKGLIAGSGRERVGLAAPAGADPGGSLLVTVAGTGGYNAPSGIFAMSGAGADPRVVVSGTSVDSDGSFSRDGTQIAFTRRDGTFQSQPR